MHQPATTSRAFHVEQQRSARTRPAPPTGWPGTESSMAGESAIFLKTGFSRGLRTTGARGTLSDPGTLKSPGVDAPRAALTMHGVFPTGEHHVDPTPRPSPRILDVAPTHDDPEILCGGTMAKPRQAGLPRRHARPDKRRAGRRAAPLAIRAAEAGPPTVCPWSAAAAHLDLPNRSDGQSRTNCFVWRRPSAGCGRRSSICPAGRTARRVAGPFQSHLLAEAARFYSQ